MAAHNWSLVSYLTDHKYEIKLGTTEICYCTSFILEYMNDIAERLFSLKGLVAAHIAYIAGIINHDLQLLTKWDRQWLVIVNPLKTGAVLFTLKTLDFLPQLVFDIIPISLVDNHKHLLVV